MSGLVGHRATRVLWIAGSRSWPRSTEQITRLASIWKTNSQCLQTLEEEGYNKRVVNAKRRCSPARGSAPVLDPGRGRRPAGSGRSPATTGRGAAPIHGGGLRPCARQARTKPLLDAMRLWLEQGRAELSRRSPLGEAIGYALNHWQRLTRFAGDGRIGIGLEHGRAFDQTDYPSIATMLCSPAMTSGRKTGRCWPR